MNKDAECQNKRNESTDSKKGEIDVGQKKRVCTLGREHPTHWKSQAKKMW